MFESVNTQTDARTDAGSGELKKNKKKNFFLGGGGGPVRGGGSGWMGTEN